MRDAALGRLLGRVAYAEDYAARYDRMACESLDPVAREHWRAVAQAWRRYADRLWRIYLLARDLSGPGTVVQ
jgi:hypothetical protein